MAFLQPDQSAVLIMVSGRCINQYPFRDPAVRLAGCANCSGCAGQMCLAELR
jgi:hypothetical protein